MLDRHPLAFATAVALGLAACVAPAPARVAPPAMPGGWYGHAQPSAPPQSQQLAAQQTAPHAAPSHGAPYQQAPYQAAPYQATPYQAAPYQAAPPVQAPLDPWGRSMTPAAAATGAPNATSAPAWPQPLDPWAGGRGAELQSPPVAQATGAQSPAGAALEHAIDAATGRSLPPGADQLDIRGVYDADGGPARAPAPGAVGDLAASERELEHAGSGRLYLLEMYQQALDERDALEVEVGTLTARLEQLQARIAEQDAALDVERAARASADAEIAGLRAENQDLTGRVVTAQIRRLEAEKMLLEARLDEERAVAQPGGPPRPVADPAAPTSSSGRAPATQPAAPRQ